MKWDIIKYKINKTEWLGENIAYNQKGQETVENRDHSGAET